MNFTVLKHICFWLKLSPNSSHGKDLKMWLIRGEQTTASLTSSGTKSLSQQTVIADYLTHGGRGTTNKTCNLTSSWTFLLRFIHRAALGADKTGGCGCVTCSRLSYWLIESKRCGNKLSVSRTFSAVKRRGSLLPDFTTRK